MAEADALRAKIAALTVAAPEAGTIADPVARGKRIAAGAVVATLAGAPTLLGTFDISASTRKDFAVDQPVKVAAEGMPEQVVSCVVVGVEGAELTVTCGADGGLAEGTTVVLVP